MTAKTRKVWNYGDEPTKGGDARKIVTLEQDGMRWTGVRAYHTLDRQWYNGNEPERAQVIAWRHLDVPATGSYDRGQLVNADDAITRSSVGSPRAEK